MKVFLFSDRLSVADKRLLSIINDQIPLDNLYICRYIDSLKSRIEAAGGESIVVIILAHDRNTLDSVIAVSKMCSDLPVIMILPDRAWITHYLGRLFSPCCISYMDSDFSDVALELAKMMMQDATLHARQNIDQNPQQKQASGII